MVYAYAREALRLNAEDSSWRLLPGFSAQSHPMGSEGRSLGLSFVQLQRPDGRTLHLERIEGEGPFGWIATEALQPNVSYTQVASDSLGDGVDGADTRLSHSNDTPVACFAPGTLIATDDGEIPVDWLRPGDMVLTRDDGYQPLLWLGRVAVSGTGSLTIPQSAFGPGLPARHLQITNATNVLLQGSELELHFGEAEMFAAAQDLLDPPKKAASRLPDFFHLLLPRPQVILAEGLWVESFCAAPELLAHQAKEARDLIARLTRGRHNRTARACLTAWEARIFRSPGAMALGRIAA